MHVYMYVCMYVYACVLTHECKYMLVHVDRHAQASDVVGMHTGTCTVMHKNCTPVGYTYTHTLCTYTHTLCGTHTHTHCLRVGHIHTHIVHVVHVHPHTVRTLVWPAFMYMCVYVFKCMYTFCVASAVQPNDGIPRRVMIAVDS